MTPCQLPSTPPQGPSSVSPSLSDEDKERIETWFEHDSRLTEVAQTLGIGVLTLAAWAKQPHIKEALLDICEIARFRTETLRAEAEHASVNRLLSLVRYSNHEEIARRAAANILGQGLRPSRTTAPPTGAPASPPPRDPPAPRDTTTSPSIPTPRVPHFPLPEGGGQGVGSSTSQHQASQLATGATSRSNCAPAEPLSQPLQPKAPPPNSSQEPTPQAENVQPPTPLGAPCASPQTISASRTPDITHPFHDSG